MGIFLGPCQTLPEAATVLAFVVLLVLGVRRADAWKASIQHLPQFGCNHRRKKLDCANSPTRKRSGAWFADKPHERQPVDGGHHHGDTARNEQDPYRYRSQCFEYRRHFLTSFWLPLQVTSEQDNAIDKTGRLPSFSSCARVVRSGPFWGATSHVASPKQRIHETLSGPADDRHASRNVQKQH